MNDDQHTDKRPDLIIIVVLIAITFLAFHPVLRLQVTSWDDNLYLANPLVRNLSSANIPRMFAGPQVGFYHPLVILSLSIDYALWGENYLGFHLHNLLLHIVNVILVYTFIILLFRNRFYAAFSALLFGIHPINVEPVAWITSRKDVLCSVFFLAGLNFYLIYRRGSRLIFYWLALFAHLLALLAKPMAVTLPLVLILFDFYLYRLKSLPRLLPQKVPFFILSGLTGVMAVITQKSAGALGPGNADTSWQTILFIFRNLAHYLQKLILPLDLSPLYDYPTLASLSRPEFVISIAVIVLILAVALFSLRYSKHFFFSIAFWFVIPLPIIGFVPLGASRVGDRFMYLPSIGIFLAVCSGWYALKNLLGKRNARITGLCFLTVLAFLLIPRTWRQIPVWHGLKSVWQHVIKLNPKSSFAHNNLGAYYKRSGDLERSMQEFYLALKFKPDHSKALANLGAVYMLRENYYEAALYLERAIEIAPNDARFHNALGLARAKSDNLDEAEKHFKIALELNPSLFDARDNMGVLYEIKGKFEESAKQYRVALSIRPSDTVVRKKLDNVLEKHEKFIEKVRQLTRAIENDPTNSIHYNKLGQFYHIVGDSDKAIGVYEKAIAKFPQNAGLHNNLGMLYLASGKYELARRRFEESIKFQPDYYLGHFNLGEVFYKQKKYDIALKHFQRALDLKPKMIEAKKRIEEINGFLNE